MPEPEMAAAASQNLTPEAPRAYSPLFEIPMYVSCDPPPIEPEPESTPPKMCKHAASHTGAAGGNSPAKKKQRMESRGAITDTNANVNASTVSFSSSSSSSSLSSCCKPPSARSAAAARVIISAPVLAPVSEDEVPIPEIPSSGDNNPDDIYGDDGNELGLPPDLIRDQAVSSSAAAPPPEQPVLASGESRDNAIVVEEEEQAITPGSPSESHRGDVPDSENPEILTDHACSETQN
ncbi:hypothetical protein C8J56DRAFT_1158144 [Mycena floridula]|nr:hypothetical protein C8J56DRAFT_1158144 [Mycena floridula]